MSNALITGGAGFIGSHLAHELLNHGYKVRILDSLEDHVHPDGQRPSYLSRDAEFIRGDVCDAGTVAPALGGIDAVFHLASSVGFGHEHLWGGPGMLRWERAVSYCLDRYEAFSDIQDQRPAPLHDLEHAP